MKKIALLFVGSFLMLTSCSKEDYNKSDSTLLKILNSGGALTTYTYNGKDHFVYFG